MVFRATVSHIARGIWLLGNGIPDDAAAHGARAARVVNLAEAHGPAERVGADHRS